MGWIKDVLSLNAKIFSALNEIDALNKRVSKMDDDMRSMGQDIAHLKGFIAATKFDLSSSEGRRVTELRTAEIQRRLNAIHDRITPKVNEE